MTPSKRATPESKRETLDPELGPHGVWYRLFTLTNILSRPFQKNVAKQYSLSPADWCVLNTLVYMPGVASHEICKISGLIPMNVSRAVSAVRKRGLIREQIDPDNRKRKLLSLTPEGLALYRKVAPHARRETKFMLEGMSREEVATLGSLVERLIARLES